MNKLIVLSYALVILCCPVFANDLTKVSTIEKDLFGIEYKDENLTNRLSRIEKHLYGKTNKGTNAQRINIIAESSGISFAPKMTTEEKKIAAADFEKEDNTVSYPVIDMMEEKVFHKTFQGENVYKRVERLEQTTFGKKSQGELSDRTDRLKAELIAVKQNTNSVYSTDPKDEIIYSQNNLNSYQPYDNYTLAQNNPPFYMKGGYPTGGAANSYGYSNTNSDFDYALSAAEDLVFGKNYANKTEAERLEKLENKIFKKTYSGDKVSRLERVVSAATAKKSGNIYHENKFDKYLSTGMQIGTVLLMILAMIL